MLYLRSMGQPRKPGATFERADDQEMRDQEVLRANKELAAYFKGRRTEREARAALKIIKAFVRERERMDPKRRPPLPHASGATAPKAVASRRNAGARGEASRWKPQLKSHDTSSIRARVSTEPQMDAGSPPFAEPDEPTRE